MLSVIGFIFLFCIFTNIHSKLITYTLYQTNDICQHNWKGSICLPIFPLNKTHQPLSIEFDISNKTRCRKKLLVYIRTRQCIYCPRNLHHIHCNHQQQLRQIISTKKDYIHRNRTAVISVSLLTVLITGSLFVLVFIKRSQAHTNLLELLNHDENSNIHSTNRIKTHGNIKSVRMNLSQPIQSNIPNRIKTTK